MKRILFGLALLLLPATANAQCNGVFPNNTVCGNVTGSANTPRPTVPSAFAGTAGGSNGQVQYNNNGALGGLTNTQLTALINQFSATLAGDVPASGGGTINFLRADGTWANPITAANLRTLTTSATLLNTDTYIIVNASAVATFNLPAAPATNQVIYIKDGNGDSGTNAITVAGNGNNIDGQTTLLLQAAFRGVVLLWNGTQWNATAGYERRPYQFPNNVNTITQIANPGIGATAPATFENVFFYDNDGDGFLGPSARPDILVLTNSPFNVGKRHLHLRFDQVSFSTTRPVQQMAWNPVGAGSFAIVAGASGGSLQISTNTSATGDGGTVSEDFNTIQFGTGTDLLFIGGPITANANQQISFGFAFDSNNQIYFQRTDTASEGDWFANCINSGTQSSFDTGIKTDLNRTFFSIFGNGSGGVDFYIGNTNNTQNKVATCTTNIPTGQNLKPFATMQSNLSAVQRVLSITDFYTITAE